MPKKRTDTHAFQVAGAKQSNPMTEREAEEAWEKLSREGYDVSVVDRRQQGGKND